MMTINVSWLFIYLHYNWIFRSRSCCHRYLRLRHEAAYLGSSTFTYTMVIVEQAGVARSAMPITIVTEESS